MPQKHRASAALGAALWFCIVSAPPASGNEGPGRESSTLNDSDSLLVVQNQIIDVVRQNMETCVAISDGGGFGSGVIVSPDGLILTAGHVVSTGVESFELFFPSGRTATARLIGYNLDVDAAMLQIDGNQKWPFVRIAESDQPTPGSWAIGLGHSGGYELGRKPPVRTGRVLEIRDHMVVTDSVLIGGDSGGPLFDLAGQLIGIHSSIGDVITENRHVSMGTFRKYWSRMAAGERWGSLPELEGEPENNDPAPSRNGNSRPGSSPTPAPQTPPSAAGNPGHRPASSALLGVTVEPDNRGGALITAIEPGSPAGRIGLKTGDRIEELNRQKILSGSELESQLKRLAVGSSAEILVTRNGSPMRLVVILDRF